MKDFQKLTRNSWYIGGRLWVAKKKKHTGDVMHRQYSISSSLNSDNFSLKILFVIFFTKTIIFHVSPFALTY